MKQRISFLIVLALAAMTANAQDILNELRRDQAGQGKIVVNQSREIEQLVNPKAQVEKTAAKTVTTTKTTTPTTAKANATVAAKTPTQTTTQQHVTPQQQTVVKPVEPKQTDTAIASVQSPDTLAFDTIAPVVAPVVKPKKKVVRKRMDTVAADGTYEGSINLNRKVMRHAYKTTGYRIQVYNGGNTRVDRQKCEQIAARIKASYPKLPIYVHFYSPSWKCRAGNFTNKAEADSFLKKIRAMGYKTACLVKGTVSVQY